MNLTTTLPDSVTDTIRHAAESTRHVAASTAQTIAGLADDAHHRLEDLPVPGRPRRSVGRRRVVIAAALVAVIVALVARRRSASDSKDRAGGPAADARG